MTLKFSLKHFECFSRFSEKTLIGDQYKTHPKFTALSFVVDSHSPQVSKLTLSPSFTIVQVPLCFPFDGGWVDPIPPWWCPLLRLLQDPPEFPWPHLFGPAISSLSPKSRSSKDLHISFILSARCTGCSCVPSWPWRTLPRPRLGWSFPCPLWVNDDWLRTWKRGSLSWKVPSGPRAMWVW